ncbi:MAG: DUF433 domain-containing protein [Byssovorax sp.]
MTVSLHDPELQLAQEGPGIEQTPGVLGGDACVVRTRIPVWLLESYRKLALSRASPLLSSRPTSSALLRPSSGPLRFSGSASLRSANRDGDHEASGDLAAAICAKKSDLFSLSPPGFPL